MDITTMPQYSEQSLEELRLGDYVDQPSHGFHDVKLVYGTKVAPFCVSWDYDPFSRRSVCIHCITCMPQYLDYSLEELRLADYLQRNIQSSDRVKWASNNGNPSGLGINENIFSTKFSLFNVNKDWPMAEEEPTNTPFKINNNKISNPFSINQEGPFQYSVPSINTNNAVWNRMNNPGRTMPMVIEEPPLVYQDPPTNPFDKRSAVRNTIEGLQSPFPLPSFIVDANRDKQERHTLSKLDKIEGQLSSMTSQFNSVESLMADMRSRMSVMDSKLSTMDLFVIMQQMDKRWQELGSTLASLQATGVQTPEVSNLDVPVAEDTKCADKKFLLTPPKLKVDPITEDNTDSCSTNETSRNATSFENDHSSVKRSINTLEGMMVEIKSLLENTSSQKMNVSGASCNVLSQTTPVLVSDKSVNCDASKTPEMVDEISQTNCEAKADNLMDSCQPRNDSLSICDNVENKTDGDNISNKSGSLYHGEKVAREEDIVKDITNKVIKNVITERLEDGFVMVQSSDVDDKLKDGFKKDSRSSSLSEVSLQENREFKVCDDITEYLEVNLGKKKDAVYEFAFEAKPDGPSFDSLIVKSASEENPRHRNSLGVNTHGNFSKDDSFSTFESSGNLKHSSPLVNLSTTSTQKEAKGKEMSKQKGNT